VRLENLEEYTGLKSVFLEGNGLESLDGLQARHDIGAALRQPSQRPHCSVARRRSLRAAADRAVLAVL